MCIEILKRINSQVIFQGYFNGTICNSNIVNKYCSKSSWIIFFLDYLNYLHVVSAFMQSVSLTGNHPKSILPFYLPFSLCLSNNLSLSIYLPIYFCIAN